MDIRFSRHAKRRMALYEIEGRDVKLAIEKGERQTLPNGKICFIFKSDRFKYPLKIVAVEKTNNFLIVTAYPLKK